MHDEEIGRHLEESGGSLSLCLTQSFFNIYTRNRCDENNDALKFQQFFVGAEIDCHFFKNPSQKIISPPPRPDPPLAAPAACGRGEMSPCRGSPEIQI
ncbi:hypothetical protein EVAR_41965_1 [Eumeta japonica]|uniref:Uncharacterized protein n=1 Tax=Eumeta variegata TaxID=151549 RepID=A0A4C1WTU2_EUMVA|nr:hypothetical protein EVAR_41965_1 [Eumeta japonica]